jgi:hypothetical protein
MRPCASFPPSSGPTAMPILCVEWLCFQERWNPEVAIIFGAAARYCLATVGSSHDGARPGNSTRHTRAIRLHTGVVERDSSFTSSRTGHGSSQVLEMLPDFSCVSCACAFGAGGDASIFLSGPVEAKERRRVLSREVGSSGISWRILSLVKKSWL